MMKKTYITPEIEVNQVELQGHLMDISIIDTELEDGDDVGLVNEENEFNEDWNIWGKD